MNTFDVNYQGLLRDVLDSGTDCSSRGLHYRQKFGQQTMIDLREGFPLSTLRKLPWQAIVDETLFDISGSSQHADMGKAMPWWAYLADESGHIDYTYGHAWRHTWGDQLRWAIDQLSYNATSRSIILQTYDANRRSDTEAGPVVCPPCHTQLIFSSDGEHLDVMVIARSNDLSIGYPSDVARYSLLTLVLASWVQLEARHLCMPSANNHVYFSNLDHAEELLRRQPKSLPKVRITADVHPVDIRSEHIELLDYDPHPILKPSFN